MTVKVSEFRENDIIKSVAITNLEDVVIYVGTDTNVNPMTGMPIQPYGTLEIETRHLPLTSSFTIYMVNLNLVKRLLKSSKAELAVSLTSADELERELAQLILGRVNVA